MSTALTVNEETQELQRDASILAYSLKSNAPNDKARAHGAVLKSRPKCKCYTEQES